MGKQLTVVYQIGLQIPLVVQIDDRHVAESHGPGWVVM